MKKGILIFSAVLMTLSLLAFSVLNSTNTYEVKDSTIAENIKAPQKIDTSIFSDFIYDVGTRFSPIKKADLNSLRSFDDIIEQEHAQRIIAYTSLTVFLVQDDKKMNTKAVGTSGEFNTKQLKMLQDFDTSTNLVIRAEYQGKHEETGVVEDTYSSPYFTIVPEKQAVYADGKEALITFLKEKGKAAVAKAHVDAKKLKPAKLYFTVTTNGTVDKVKLDRSSNYPEIDDFMIELIQKTPRNWIPAENSNGEKVEQELVVSFGLLGC
ncbi:MAG: hypothetical protein ACJA1H_002175 [Glaciecola sp.]|jgi:hypothetical protein